MKQELTIILMMLGVSFGFMMIAIRIVNFVEFFLSPFFSFLRVFLYRTKRCERP